MGLQVRNSNDGSNGCNISDRWSCVVRIVTGIVRTHTGVPEMLRVTVIGMMLFPMPPIGISTRVVIFWVGLIR